MPKTGFMALLAGHYKYFHQAGGCAMRAKLVELSRECTSLTTVVV